MDPISRATVPNTIPAPSRVGATATLAPLAPALPVPPSSAAAALATQSSTQVDLSPLGQFLSGVALSRRQLLALQGATDEARAANTPVNVNEDLLALARQLTESFAQLQTSGIDASQLATDGDAPGSLAQRYDLLSGDGTTDAAAALAQDGSLLTQAQLARIGIDLRNEEVDATTLQAAYAADSPATLDALQQGTDVLAQVGAVLARQQGVPLAGVVEADLTGAALPASAAQAAQPQAVDEAPPQTAAIAQRQLELQQQLEAEELNLDLQAQRTDSQRVDALRIDSERMNTEQLAQQEDDARAAQVQVRAGQGQADAALATAQTQLAQQNTTQAQQLAVQAAGMAVPPPSSQDPSVAAAIAAYNLNNAALNPGLMHRPSPASDARLPLVAPVAAVEPIKPVDKI
jgi:hypothetical protein